MQTGREKTQRNRNKKEKQELQSFIGADLLVKSIKYWPIGCALWHGEGILIKLYDENTHAHSNV